MLTVPSRNVGDKATEMRGLIKVTHFLAGVLTESLKPLEQLSETSSSLSDIQGRIIIQILPLRQLDKNIERALGNSLPLETLTKLNRNVGKTEHRTGNCDQTFSHIVCRELKSKLYIYSLWKEHIYLCRLFLTNFFCEHGK
jgi:hypothetical protein